MDEKTLLRVVKKISDTGPYVFHNGLVRQKSAPFKVLRMRRATFMALMGGGYVDVSGVDVKLTSRAHRILAPDEDGKSRSAKYAQRMRDRGCVRRSVWVHPEDLGRFDEFVMTLKGTS